MTTLIVIIVIAAIAVIALIQYARPSQKLTMNYTQISMGEKLSYMVSNLKTELILSERDIDALIKQNMDQQLNEYTYIDGAKFYIESDILHANLNVTFANKVKAEINATYDVAWNDPKLTLTPQTLSIKDIPLPTSWLETIVIPIYEPNDSMIQISKLTNVNRELIIKLKLNLFSR